MSIQNRNVLECPRCGTGLEGRLFESLNADRHPHFRELLVERRLHRFQCMGCNQVIEVEKPLMYLDLGRRQFLACVPASERRAARPHAEALVAAFDRTVRGGPLRDQADEFLVRLTFGYEELREKLVLDGCGLYDLAVEALKAQLLAAEPWFQAEDVVTLSFDGLEPDGRLRFLPVWLAERRTALQHTVWAERRLYDAVFSEHETLLDRVPGLASGPHVSLLRLAFLAEGAPAP